MTNQSNILREVPIFTELNDEDLNLIMEMTVRRAYPKNTMIVIEEDRGDTLYIIESGSVKITRHDEEGREIIPAILGHAEFFGQIELDVVETVDTTMVVLVPESGDDIQLMKAGILEIADVITINKSDREGAGRLQHLLEQLLVSKGNDSPWKTLVCQTSATHGDGIEKLGELLESHRAYLEKSGRQEHKRRQRARQKVELLVAREVLADFWNQDRRDALDTGLDTIPPYELARTILDIP